MLTRSHKRDARRLAAALALAAALCLPAAAAMAGSALNYVYGEPETFLGGEINAMAGTGAAVYRGGMSNVLNPALLTEAEGFRFDAGMSLGQRHEDRFTPLFDTFESYVTDTAIASNRNHYFGTGFGFAGDMARYGLPISCALSLTDRYTFAYDFQEDVRDPDSFSDPRDSILEERKVAVDGTLRDLSLGVAWKPAERISLGAAVHYAFGTREEQYLRRDFQNTANSSDRMYDFDMSGINATLGVDVKVDERLTLGFAWETPLTVDGDMDTTLTAGDGLPATTGSEAEVKYPSRFRAGLAYYPRTEPRTLFTVDFEIAAWSDIEDDRFESDPVLEDTYDVRIGLQHIFYNGVPMRFGFRHVDSYADSEAARTTFSAGIGKPLAAGMIDFSVELGKTTFDQGHWFDYPAGFVSAPIAKVEETFFRFGAGYVVNF